MERWLILNKLIPLFFIVCSLLLQGSGHLAWPVLLLLLYICGSISLYVWQNKYLINSLYVSTIALAILGYLYVDPLFILLLSVVLIEFVSQITNKKWIIFVIAIFPVFYLNNTIQISYAFIALYAFMVHSMAIGYSRRLLLQDQQLDTMRLAQQKLIQQLHESDAFLKQSAYTFKLEERNRISQSLHDDLGHAITGALIQMEAAKAILPNNQNKAAELLDNSILITKEGIESIRLTLKDLKPPTELVGLNRLKLEVDAFSAKHPIRTLLTTSGNLNKVQPIHWKIIQENITEALTNALKYAGCTQISIDITVLNKLIKAQVKDNGKGATVIKKGLGLIGMEERTAALGGNIITDGKQGFSVTTLLPIPTEKT